MYVSPAVVQRCSAVVRPSIMVVSAASSRQAARPRSPSPSLSPSPSQWAVGTSIRMLSVATNPQVAPSLPAGSRCVVLFPGQGSQVLGMGAVMAERHQAAREVFQEVDEALGFPLSELMWRGPQELLVQTQHAQPAILAHSIACARVVEAETGFSAEHAACAMGHSLGEYSALVFAKSLSLADGAKLAYLRGKAMAKAVESFGGNTAMSALFPTSAEKLAPLCEAAQASTGETVEIANINSATQVVISGTESAVSEVETLAKSSRIARRAVRLAVSAPFHCSLLSRAIHPLRDALEGVAISRPVCPVISNVTALPHPNDSDCIVESLLQQVTKPVQWERSMLHAAGQVGVTHFVELGPGTVLTRLASGSMKEVSEWKIRHLFGEDEPA